MFWNKNNLITGYKEKILNSFPADIKTDVELIMNVLPLKKNNVLLYDGQTHKVENLIHDNFQIVRLNNETLKISCRVYFNEPDLGVETNLTETQKTILNCLYLRHHDGYIRQKRLEMLINSSDYFVIPFTFQLLGEYVIEILEVLDKHINEKNISKYLNFIKENPKYWQQTESRMISYWNEYYRRKYPKLNDYIGKKIIDKIKKANAQ